MWCGSKAPGRCPASRRIIRGRSRACILTVEVQSGGPPAGIPTGVARQSAPTDHSLGRLPLQIPIVVQRTKPRPETRQLATVEPDAAAPIADVNRYPHPRPLHQDHPAPWAPHGGSPICTPPEKQKTLHSAWLRRVLIRGPGSLTGRPGCLRHSRVDDLARPWGDLLPLHWGGSIWMTY